MYNYVYYIKFNDFQNVLEFVDTHQLTEKMPDIEMF